MNPSLTAPSNGAPRDKDLVALARPGHGIPSQDPDPAAQMPLEPDEAEREARSGLAGAGAIVGAALGAAIGTVVVGPAGVMAGTSLGALAGAVGGGVAGALVPRPQRRG